MDAGRLYRLRLAGISVTDIKLTPVPSRRGRPRVKDATVPVTTWVPRSTFDRLTAYARKHDESMSAILRNMVILRLPQK
jgi:hypothetical protein